MTLEHVFYAYDRTTHELSGHYRYCPFCASPLSPRTFDGRPTCAGCGFVHFRNPSPGVSVLVTDGEQVLLGRRVARNPGGQKWCLPGGFIEYGEDFLSAAVREVKEETGLEVEIRSIINVVSNFLSPRLHTLVVVLLARVVAGTLAPGDDLSEMAWFPRQGPLPEMAFDADRYIVETYARTGLSGLPVGAVDAAGCAVQPSGWDR